MSTIEVKPTPEQQRQAREWLEHRAINCGCSHSLVILMRLQELERERDEAIASVSFIRCTKHVKVRQVNDHAHGGGECGACIEEERAVLSVHLLTAEMDLDKANRTIQQLQADLTRVRQRRHSRLRARALAAILAAFSVGVIHWTFWMHGSSVWQRSNTAWIGWIACMLAVAFIVRMTELTIEEREEEERREERRARKEAKP